MGPARGRSAPGHGGAAAPGAGAPPPEEQRGGPGGQRPRCGHGCRGRSGSARGRERSGAGRARSRQVRRGAPAGGAGSPGQQRAAGAGRGAGMTTLPLGLSSVRALSAPRLGSREGPPALPRRLRARAAGQRRRRGTVPAHPGPTELPSAARALPLRRYPAAAGAPSLCGAGAPRGMPRAGPEPGLASPARGAGGSTTGPVTPLPAAVPRCRSSGGGQRAAPGSSALPPGAGNPRVGTGRAGARGRGAGRLRRSERGCAALALGRMDLPPCLCPHVQ